MIRPRSQSPAQPGVSVRRDGGTGRSRPRQAVVLLTSLLLTTSSCTPSPTAKPPVVGTTGTASAPPVGAATGAGDALAADLALYLRLLEPNGGSADELGSFLQSHPTWPNRALLGRRLDAALAVQTDPDVLARLCPRAPLSTAAVLVRCTDPALAPAARRAWVNGIDTADAEASFLSVWHAVLTPSDQADRFRRQQAAGSLDAATRTAQQLPAADRALAMAEIALHRGDPGADTQAATLTADQQADPVLVLELARWLRKANRLDQAVALWRGRGASSEAAALPTLQGKDWAERDALARALLDARRDADALQVAADPTALAPAQRSDSDFLAGWIALQRLGDPARAQKSFEPLTRTDSVISRTRGLYWTARARAAQGDAEGAAAWFSRAASWPTSFYGQLSVARLDPANPQTLVDPSLNAALLRPGIAALQPQRWTADEAVRFAGQEFARAAELLVAWNDPRHARAFLLLLDQNAATDSEHAMAASLANRLGLPDVAVAIARSAGRHGLVLAGSGWPRPFDPPRTGSVPPALVLAVMRQESSFDPGIVSPAGANGLMQVTAGSAQDIARGLNRPELADRAALFDPSTNMTLGSAFLATLLTRFGGVEPYALAGYNAGPHRVDRWLAQNGDPVHTPQAGAVDAETDTQARLLDWIESIPFAETRNYVQRVMENQAIYGQPPA